MIQQQNLEDYFRLQTGGDSNHSSLDNILPAIDDKSQSVNRGGVQEVERPLPRSLSPIDMNGHKSPEQNYKIVEGGLAECPNCSRTFFPNRLTVHLKSCKPGKPLIPKKNKKVGLKFTKENKGLKNYNNGNNFNNMKNLKSVKKDKKQVQPKKFRMPLLGKGKLEELKYRHDDHRKNSRKSRRRGRRQ